MPMLHSPFAGDREGDFDIENVLQRRVAEIRFDDLFWRSSMFVGVNQFVLGSKRALARCFIEVAVQLLSQAAKQLERLDARVMKGPNDVGDRLTRIANHID